MQRAHKAHRLLPGGQGRLPLPQLAQSRRKPIQSLDEVVDPCGIGARQLAVNLHTFLDGHQGQLLLVQASERVAVQIQVPCQLLHRQGIGERLLAKAGQITFQQGDGFLVVGVVFQRLARQSMKSADLDQKILERLSMLAIALRMLAEHLQPLLGIGETFLLLAKFYINRED